LSECCVGIVLLEVVDMVKAIGFLEDQSSAIVSWQSFEDDKAGKFCTMVGVGDDLQLLDDGLEIIDSVSTSTGGQINRLALLSTGSCFYSDTKGNVGFVSISSSGGIGKVDTITAGVSSEDAICIDSDIHRSGHLVVNLFNTKSGGYFGLIDTQRDAMLGSIPLNSTGTPNAVRLVDSSQVVVGSMICSVFDVRTSQSKKGVPGMVLETTAVGGGRSFTAIESDGSHSVIAGDSAGGLWLWDVRQSGKEPLKSVHAHSGAVLAIHLANGIVGSTSTDNSVSLWTVAEKFASVGGSGVGKKKHRKLMMDLGDVGGKLKRLAVEGNGSALGVCVTDTGGVSYVTDTGIVALGHISEWQ
jgi:hypothetical protein